MNVRKSVKRNSKEKSTINVKNTVMFKVINCSKHKNRLNKFTELAKKAKVPFKRVNCVYAKNWSSKRLCNLIDDHTIAHDTEITAGEAAINLSHRKCWELFLKSSNELLCVFEDDCKIKKDFMRYLNCLLNNETMKEKSFDVLYLINGNWAGTISSQVPWLKFRCKSQEIVVRRETKEYNASGSCYIINKKFAEKLVERQYPLKLPVDNFMGSLNLKKFKHITIKTKKDSEGCYTLSPFVRIPCPYVDSKNTTHQTKSDEGLNSLKCYEKR